MGSMIGAKFVHELKSIRMWASKDWLFNSHEQRVRYIPLIIWETGVKYSHYLKIFWQGLFSM